ncbi:MAG: hypothetical protein WAM14_10655, partial [Candidatus Nitrosopolaris sp.]
TERAYSCPLVTEHASGVQDLENYMLQGTMYHHQNILYVYHISISDLREDSNVASCFGLNLCTHSNTAT